MKRVVSLSYRGSSDRDHMTTVRYRDTEIQVERRGVPGGLKEYIDALSRLDSDPEVLTIGLGGINYYLSSASDKHVMHAAKKMADATHTKILCDGFRLKSLWEPHVIRQATQKEGFHLRNRNILMVCATDRWGMAAQLHQYSSRMVVGDLMFSLGWPVPLRSWRLVERLTPLAVPIATLLPFHWLYPDTPDRGKPKFQRWYDWADVIAGDFKFIGRHAPIREGDLYRKTIITNTTTTKDVRRLKKLGLSTLLTTTPSCSGRTFGTNLVEALVAGVLGKRPDEITLTEIINVFQGLGWETPSPVQLND